jgi:hypothetical protein
MSDKRPEYDDLGLAEVGTETNRVPNPGFEVASG